MWAMIYILENDHDDADGGDDGGDDDDADDGGSDHDEEHDDMAIFRWGLVIITMIGRTATIGGRRTVVGRSGGRGTI